jgi:hypothetical protein
MGKASKNAASGKNSKSKIRILQAVLAVVVLGAAYTVYLLTHQDTAAATSQSSGSSVANQNLPATLDPSGFDDPDIRRAYQAAKDSPEALAAVKCYCGCMNSAGHRSNLDCFTDAHGAG